MIMIFVLITGWFVQFSWNNVVVTVFPAVAALTYWKATALGLIMSLFMSLGKSEPEEQKSYEQFLLTTAEALIYSVLRYAIFIVLIIIVKQFI